MTTQEQPVNKPKKTFGDWFRSLFEAHLKDMRDENERYVNTFLKQDISLLKENYKWARALQSEFAQISSLLEQKVLSCTHSQEDKKSKAEGWEQCNVCGCSRWDRYKDQNFEDVYYQRSFDILNEYKNVLSEDERKVLDDFYQRNIGDMSDANKWNGYNQRMKDIFNKYPVWGSWKF